MRYFMIAVVSLCACAETEIPDGELMYLPEYTKVAAEVYRGLSEECEQDVVSTLTLIIRSRYQLELACGLDPHNMIAGCLQNYDGDYYAIINAANPKFSPKWVAYTTAHEALHVAFECERGHPDPEHKNQYWNDLWQREPEMLEHWLENYGDYQ